MSERGERWRVVLRQAPGELGPRSQVFNHTFFPCLSPTIDVPQPIHRRGVVRFRLTFLDQSERFAVFDEVGQNE